jgi:predicted glycogen debranching enzyme
MIRLSREELDNFEHAVAAEWLEANGLGGFASSTALGINTRKYHALLNVALNPPVDRVVLVSRFDETVTVGSEKYDISAGEYEAAVYPEGYKYLKSLRIDPFPIFTYEVGGVTIEKSVFMVCGENMTVVTYTVKPPPGGPRRSQVVLSVRPFIAGRDHHLVQRENGEFDRSVHVGPDSLNMKPYPGIPRIYIGFDGGRFQHSGYWYRNFFYRKERERGYPAVEDLYSPGLLVFNFDEADSQSVILSTEPIPNAPAEGIRGKELRRRRRLVASPLAQTELGKYLVTAADTFVVRRGEEGRSVIAGYPWFTDWGRDTMISLPGLTLVTGRYEDARRILSTFVASIKDGLIPNRFTDEEDAAEYNTIDATLWLFEAVRRYYDYTNDVDFVSSLLPALRDAIRHHLEGTMFSIKAGDDCLLGGGTPDVQLTWMDAKVNGEVITSRAGKAVEINALWYNALMIMSDLSADAGGLADESKYDIMASRVLENFNREFWNEERGCLYDVIGDGFRDASVRPNQIFAMSLTYPVLDRARRESVLEVVRQELVTPFGLRTLSPQDPRYCGRYEGTLYERDKAYHQGTVWPWLIGPYIRAYVRTYGLSEETTAYCRELFKGFLDHMKVNGLGTIAEVYDGDPPHRPRGCFSQAWSVAEVLRALAEDLHAAPRPSAPAMSGVLSRRNTV